MKKKYRVILIVLFFCAYAYFVYSLIYRWTYSDLNENKLYNENALTTEVDDADPAILILEEDAESVDIVNPETVYILEKYEIISGEYTNEILPIPVELMGFDKDELYNYYVNYSNKLQSAMSDETDNVNMITGLSERNIIATTKTVELVTFENNVLVVRMAYEYKEPVYEFVLANENGRIVIYRISTNEIFANTNIKISDLPYGLRNEIDKGKYFTTEQQVYYFLESYSS